MVRQPQDSLPAVHPQRQTRPLLAAAFSLLLAGSGQIYNGETGKGVGFFVTWTVLWIFALGWMVNIWAAVDAYQVSVARRELN